jgi:hypothetical protein
MAVPASTSVQRSNLAKLERQFAGVAKQVNGFGTENGVGGWMRTEQIGAISGARRRASLRAGRG